MTKIYPVNVHGIDGKHLYSAAFKTEGPALRLLDNFFNTGKDGVICIEDDFGHRAFACKASIGYMIMVDEEKDAELGRIISQKQLEANLKSEARAKLVTN